MRDFKVDDFALSPEQVVEFQKHNDEIRKAQEAAATKTRKASRKRAETWAKRTPFVMLPYAEAMAMAGKRRDARWAVWIELAHQAFAHHTDTVVLGNKALEAAGIDRKAKARALQALEEDGLIRVSKRGFKRPEVVLLWMRHPH